MDHEPGDHTRSALPQHRLTYPLNKVVAAVGRSDADIVAAALGEAGFSRDRIENITAEEIEGHGELAVGSGLRRLLIRLQPSPGNGINDHERARRMPTSGRAMVQVRVREGTEQVRVHAIWSEQDGEAMQSYGRSTVTHID